MLRKMGTRRINYEYSSVFTTLRIIKEDMDLIRSVTKIFPSATSYILFFTWKKFTDSDHGLKRSLVFIYLFI